MSAPLPTSGWLPWTRSCFVCGENNPHGLHLRSRIEGDRIVLEHTAREADLGYRSIVHGGIAMTLLDEVMTWAAIARLRRACVAAEMTARFHHPIAPRLRLRVEGWVTSARGRLVLTEGALCDPEGTILVSASAKYLPMPSGMVAVSSKDFVAHPDAMPLDVLFPDTDGKACASR